MRDRACGVDLTEHAPTGGPRAARRSRIARDWTALVWSATLAACLGDPLTPRIPRIDVTATDLDPVWLRTRGAPLALRCAVVGVAPPPTTVAATSTTGVVAGSECGALTVTRSGLDTLVLRAAGLERRFAIAVALPPELASASADRLTIDGLPPDTVDWWAPSARLNSRGEVELYAAGYRTIPPDSLPVGSLYRLVQATPGDPLHFRFDGVVLQPNADPCSLMGAGIENVAIVPRAEGDGFRMLLAAGSWECYGWQVFSAVSADERSWSVEQGIRVPDGPLPDPLGAPPDSAPWPVGEGIVVRRLPASGEWQMIVGGTVPVHGRDDSDLEIVEWRSPDQLTWHYHAAHFTLADLGLPTGRSLYSPTVREFAPGLYRMVFAEDGSFDLTTGTRLRTALSADGEHWQLEGTLVDNPAISVFYASLVGDRLYTLSAAHGTVDPHDYLSAFTLRMP